MNHLAIVSNRIKDEDFKIAEDIRLRILEQSKDAIVDIIDVDDYPQAKKSGTECVLVLGGDGTLLSTAKKSIGADTPLIGVNLGGLGYLAEVEVAAIDEAIAHLLKGEYHVEERMMLEGQAVIGQQATPSNANTSAADKMVAGTEEVWISALNDVVLSRRLDLQLIGYRVYVNDVFLSDFYGDGIILSSPTGSTGYNMSAGGSIVEPNAQLIVLTPVCPHTLNTRSVILSADDEIVVEILPPKGLKPVEVGAYFDGGNAKVLHPGDKLRIRKSSSITNICKISDEGFLEILQKKMND